MSEASVPKKQEMSALSKSNSVADKELRIANNEIAKHGDFIVDSHSKMSGRLRYTWQAWIVAWEDEIETIVYDPSLLTLKK